VLVRKTLTTVPNAFMNPRSFVATCEGKTAGPLHDSGAMEFVPIRDPVYEMVDANNVEGVVIGLRLKEETVKEDIVAVAELIVDAVRVEMATLSIVAVGCTTGTHWPNIWMPWVAESMLRGSPTDRTQYVPAGTN
jgi:hypothetical protein